MVTTTISKLQIVDKLITNGKLMTIYLLNAKKIVILIMNLNNRSNLELYTIQYYITLRNRSKYRAIFTKNAMLFK